MSREDFITVEQSGDVALLWIDHQIESQNIVSPPIIELLDELFSEFEANPAFKAGVLISRKANFIAGADIKSFAIKQKGDFRPFQERGHRALERLEKSNKPVVAAIHGACLGLGTELALACHLRIASDHASTRFALPEVQLGLLPGGGGTQRLPRRVGIQRALDMMLTGRNIYAYQAKKMGLVDALTDRHKLLHAAIVMAKRQLEKPLERSSKKTFVGNALEGTGPGRAMLFKEARKRALKKSRGNYPAIPAIIDCVETGYKKGITKGYEKELELFEALMLTPESKALRGLFFKMTENKKQMDKEATEEIERMCVIGAGLMGAGIAEVSVSKGVDVVLKDIDRSALTGAQKQIWKGIKKKLKYKSITKIKAEQQMQRLRPQLTYENLAHVDLALEAVVENMAVKKQIIDDVQKATSAKTIFASNTSSLSIGEMADHAQHPERVIGMHYFSPVPKMPLLEIVTTPRTAESVVDACVRLGVKQGKTCIVVKDAPGFYVNRILAPYMNEALLMLDEGLQVETIDRAFLDAGFPLGPFALFDQVGLDIAAHTVDSLRDLVQARPGFVVHEGVAGMFKAGRLGKKNKKGFYLYEGKKKKVDPGAYSFFNGNGQKKADADHIQQRGLLLMVNEAVMCLEEEVIRSPEDGDLGAVLGIGFLPFTGGPFSYVDQVGAKHIVSSMNELEKQYGPRYTPCERLQIMARDGVPFYSGE